MYSQDSFSYLSGFIAGGAIGWISGLYLHSKIVNLLFGTPLNTPPTESSISESSSSENSSSENSSSENSSSEDSNDERIIDREKNTITFYLTDESFQYVMDLSKQNMDSFRGANSHCETKEVDVQDEIEQVFNDVSGKTIPTTSTVVSGKYVSLQNYGRSEDSPVLTPENIMPRKEELGLINEFRDIVGSSLDIAKYTVKGRGFSIHVLYTGMSNTKSPLEKYDPTTIGVRVKIVSDHGKTTPPSDDSMFITEIIDIGGVDLNDRGMIKL